MKIGILGPGRMAEVFAQTLTRMEAVECYAVASRSLDRARAFAQKYGFQTAYGSYEEMLSDPNVELVYIATPHSHHYAQMKLCIAYGKHVLCEKAFTVNASQAEEIRTLAEEKGVFVAEAIWTRYMPSRKIINNILASGVIGKINALTANLCYNVVYKPRITDPALAGGALLDVGIYGINFALMHFGSNIRKIDSTVQLTDTGVDATESITITFEDGRLAIITASIASRSDRQGVFYGEKGYIVVDNINNPQSVSIYDTDDNLLQKVSVPEQISGYEYEVQECMELIEKGETQSHSMPLTDSVFVMEVMDSIRRQWNLVYPQER